MKILRIGFTLVALTLPFAAGCGNEGSEGAAGHAGHTASASESASAPAEGVVEVRITEKGYEPARIPATVGKPIILRVTRTTERTCATELIMKDPPLRKELPLHTPVEISVTPSKTGEIAFSCAMDMIGGVIDVH